MLEIKSDLLLTSFPELRILILILCRLSDYFFFFVANAQDTSVSKLTKPAGTTRLYTPIMMLDSNNSGRALFLPFKYQTQNGLGASVETGRLERSTSFLPSSPHPTSPIIFLALLLLGRTYLLNTAYHRIVQS